MKATTIRNMGKSAMFTYVVAALAGLMFGLDVGVIAGANQFIQTAFHISDSTLERVVSSVMLGAAIAAALAGWLSAQLGRRRALIASAVLFVAGALLSASAWSTESLIFARIVLGLAVGVAAFTAPLYLAEVAPMSNRGAIISMYQLMITIGILAAFLSDTAFSYYGAWRWMLGVIAIPGALFLLGVLALPESPRWLMLRGRVEEARKVLHRLRDSDETADREVNDISEQLRQPQRGWHLFLQNHNFRRSVSLGILLQIMQQLTGINVMIYYAPRIFERVGFGTSAQMWSTVSVGVVNVLATLIAIGLVDRIGRKPILYAGFVVMSLSLGMVGLMMHLGIASFAQQIFTVIMLLTFITGFAMSAGPLVWTLCSEIQPLKGRDFGIAASTVTNWLVNGVVALTFLSLLNGIGTTQTFWLYGAFNLFFIVLIVWLVPETRGVTLEKIETNLLSGKRLRHIGR